MNNLQGMTSTPQDDTLVEFSTRFVALQNVDASKVLPYVLAVLDGIGLGTAQAVGGLGSNGGILLTTPVGIAHFLEAAITNDLDNANLENYAHSIFYPPAIIVPASAVAVPEAIEALDLIPPDMNCNFLQIDNERSAVVVSGPSSRQAAFKSDILPSLTRLVESTEKPGFPFS